MGWVWDFGANVRDLLLVKGRLTECDYHYYVAAFVVVCFLTSVLFYVIEISVGVIRAKSILDLQYENIKIFHLHHDKTNTFLNRFMVCLLLGASAGIVGMFGVRSNVLEPSIEAAIVVGVAWPYLLATLFGARQAIPPDDFGDRSASARVEEAKAEPLPAGEPDATE